jgi:hypothetical protein
LEKPRSLRADPPPLYKARKLDRKKQSLGVLRFYLKMEKVERFGKINFVVPYPPSEKP